MPTYSYACTECDDRFDAVQSFTDDSLTTCDKCSGRLRKLFGSVGVVFKGSGFYRTDNRDSSKSSTSDSSKTSDNSTSSSSSEKSSSEKSSSTSSDSSSSKTSSTASSKTAAATSSS